MWTLEKQTVMGKIKLWNEWEASVKRTPVQVWFHNTFSFFVRHKPLAFAQIAGIKMKKNQDRRTKNYSNTPRFQADKWLEELIVPKALSKQF